MMQRHAACGIATCSLPAFVTFVLAAIATTSAAGRFGDRKVFTAFVTFVLAAIATTSAAGRFGDRKVFTVAVHAALGGEGTISAVAFKSRLVAAMRAGQLELARAAMDPALVAASEVDLGRGVSYHVVVVADAVRACR